MTRDAIVIGAGPAGLAAAAMLRRAGARPLVVDRGERIGSTWRGYYDRLELQSPRWLTSLPGYHFRRAAGRWPSRDAVVAYLEEYARAYRLDMRMRTEVHRVDRVSGAWEVHTGRERLRAQRVVLATGYNRIPFVPDWPGREAFRGELVHAGDFRNGDPYRGRDVLVVGGGNSGSEIAAILADEGAGRVWLSIRRPPHVAPREAFGLPSLLAVVLTRRLPTRLVDTMLGALIRLTVGDPRKFGLDLPRTGLRTQYEETAVTPILDHGIVDHLRSGRVTPVAAVERFEANEVVLADGQRVVPDTVIAATGYERGLESLVGHLGVLRPNGRPAVEGVATHAGAPGLHFIGFTHPLSGNIREVAINAKRIGRAEARRRAGRRGLLAWAAATLAEPVRWAVTRPGPPAARDPSAAASPRRRRTAPARWRSADARAPAHGTLAVGATRED